MWEGGRRVLAGVLVGLVMSLQGCEQGSINEGAGEGQRVMADERKR